MTHSTYGYIAHKGYYRDGGAKVAFRPHKPGTRFESGARNQGGDLIRKHRVGGVSKAPSFLSGVIGDRYRVRTCPEKA